MRSEFDEPRSESRGRSLLDSVIRNLAVPLLVILSGAIGEYDFESHSRPASNEEIESVEGLRREVQAMKDGTLAILKEFGLRRAFQPWECLQAEGAGRAMAVIDAIRIRVGPGSKFDFDALLANAREDEIGIVKDFGRVCTERYLDYLIETKGDR